MIKLIHAADFHLDSPFDALSPEQAAERRREGRELFDRLSDLVEEKHAQLLLLAGDLFDSETSFYESTETLARAFGHIPAKIFISPGNHDFYSPHTPYGAIHWPDNVHIFKSNAIERVVLPELGCAIYGAGFTAAQCTHSMLCGFSAEQDGLVNIMVLHGELASADGRYNPITEAEIAASGLDYLALGHVHTYSGKRKAGHTHFAYPGCPEGRGFDELGEKGVIIGEIDRGSAQLQFCPIAKRRYGILSVDITDLSDPAAAVLNALPASSENDIYRIVLTGESGDEGPNLPSLTALLEDRFYSVTVRDATRVRRDIWEQAGADSLRGLFLQQMLQKYNTAGEREREQLELAVRFALAALEHREDLS